MINIERWYKQQGEKATLGELIIDGHGFKCWTLELPWLGNKSDISCIPAGTYIGKKHYSDKNGYCIAILDVTGRDNIQVHSGNWLHQIKGCLLVGRTIRHNHKGIMVTSSRNTLDYLLTLLPDEFTIKIT